MRGRITPSFIVALLALVVALGGTAYAAVVVTSANIKNGTIQAVDIKKQTITADRLARTCPKSKVKIEGMCIDRKPVGHNTFQPARLDCNGRGGRIMSWGEYNILRGKILGNPGKFVWANGSANSYEFISTPGVTNTGKLIQEAMDFNLNQFGDASAQDFYYRCAIAP